MQAASSIVSEESTWDQALHHLGSYTQCCYTYVQHNTLLLRPCIQCGQLMSRQVTTMLLHLRGSGTTAGGGSRDTARVTHEGGSVRQNVFCFLTWLMMKLLSVTRSPPGRGPMSPARDVLTQVWRPRKLLTALEYIGLRIWLGRGREPRKTSREINELINNDVVFQMLTKPSGVHKNGLEDRPRSFLPSLICRLSKLNAIDTKT